MSLSVAALRIATVKLLDGATSAGARVFDSAVDPRDLLGAAAAPTIVIYTDRGRRKITGRDILGADHRIDLTIELFVAKATKITGADGAAAYQIEYPATDGGYENLLRRIAYEIDTVLGGASGDWADVWRSFAISACEDEESEWDRGADAHEGRRFNFLRSVYRFEIIGDPVRGAPPGPAWSAFLDLAAADPQLSDLAQDWRVLITTPNLPTWRRQMAELGLRHGELSGIGLSPGIDHQASDTAEPAQLAGITLDPDDFEIGAEGLQT